MSYDLAVFDPEIAPKPGKAFLAWYHEQTAWEGQISYEDPSVLSHNLQAWFREIIRTFPPLNGPLASDDVDDPHLTDYSLAPGLIYAAFAWSLAEEAYEKVFELAARHQVGFFDLGSRTIWLPEGPGRLVCAP